MLHATHAKYEMVNEPRCHAIRFLLGMDAHRTCGSSQLPLKKILTLFIYLFFRKKKLNYFNKMYQNCQFIDG